VRVACIRLSTIALAFVVACAETRTSTPPPSLEFSEPPAVGAGGSAPAGNNTAAPAPSTAEPAPSTAEPAPSTAEPAPSTATPSTATPAPSTAAAVTAAESWPLKYRESWQAAAPLFQRAVSAEVWSTAMARARTPFGKLTSRRFRSATYASSLPGAPDGNYVVVQFDAAFEKNAQAVETVTPVQSDDGTWKVSGYFIK